MRKIVLWVVVAGILVSIFFGYWFNESNHNPLDYARITEVDYRAVVVDEPGGNGKMIVTERLTFDIHAASRNNLFWELWRDLSEEYSDGVKVEYRVNSVKQILDDGTELVYQESPRLYWEDEDFVDTARGLGPGKWYHSPGPYNENLRRYECVFFYVDGLYRETVVFEIEYEMVNAALRYNDCSELYITPYSESEITFLNAFQGQILVPDALMPRAGNYEAHTYGTNTGAFPFTESATANPGYYTFSFNLDKSQLQFRPYNQYIEFSLIAFGEDKHRFTNHASVNNYYHDDVLEELREEHAKYMALPRTFRWVKIIVLLWGVVVALLTLTYAFGVRRRMKKKFFFYEAEPSPYMDYSRRSLSEMDPNFAATLVFCKQKPPKDAQDGYAAVLLSLVRKGYIQLTKTREDRDWVFSNVQIVVKYNPMQPENTPEIKPLTPTEDLYFRLILRHSNGFVLPLSSFQHRVSDDYEYTNSFVTNTERALTNIGVSQGYFQKADYKQPARQVRDRSYTLGVIGALLLTVGNFVSYRTRLDLAFGAFFVMGIALLVGAVYLHRASYQFVLLTQFGENEYAKWQGLYRYLDSETHLKESTVVDLGVWELYLVYATAFGLADKVIDALNLRFPYTDLGPVLHSPYYRSRHFRVHHRRRFRFATRSARTRARMGSFGGGGGYGGGGRGGGGGGGGH